MTSAEAFRRYFVTSKIVDNASTMRRELIAEDGELLAFVSLNVLRLRLHLRDIDLRAVYGIDITKPWGTYK